MHGITCQAPSNQGWLPLFSPKFCWLVVLVVLVVVVWLEAAAKQAPGTSSRHGSSAQKNRVGAGSQPGDGLYASGI